MDKENISGEKALIEERRKKLDQLRDRGDAYGNSFKPKIMHQVFMKNMVTSQKMI